MSRKTNEHEVDPFLKWMFGVVFGMFVVIVGMLLMKCIDDSKAMKNKWNVRLKLMTDSPKDTECRMFAGMYDIWDCNGQMIQLVEK